MALISIRDDGATVAKAQANLPIPCLIDVNGNGIADAGDMTNPAYTVNARFGVECDAASTSSC
jgi:hypothetical protein